MSDEIAIMTHTAYPELIEKLEKINRCEHCPTYHGEKYGRDEESEMVINSIEAMDHYGDKLYCPWKQRNCPCYTTTINYHRKRLGCEPKPESSELESELETSTGPTTSEATSIVTPAEMMLKMRYTKGTLTG